MPRAPFTPRVPTTIAVVCMYVALVSAQPAVDQALTGLSSRDATARKDALTKINASGNPQAAGAVARLIADPQADVQEAAIDTLLTLVLPASPAAPRGNWHTFRGASESQGVEARARQALVGGVQPVRPVPPGAFDPLTDLMGDADSRVRHAATYTFGVLALSKHGLVPDRARGRALATLVKMIASPHQDSRLVAMQVAGHAFAAPLDGDPPAAPIGGEALSDALVAAMNRPDMKDQAAAIEALGRLRERRAAPALSDRFVYHREHGPRQQAVVALEALARLNDPTTTSLIRPLIEDAWTRSDDTRLAMLFARTRLFQDGSEERLRRAVGDKKTGAQARAYLLELGLVP
jgi:hypothetical protein